MPEMTDLAVSQLDFDPKNPRLGKEYTSDLEIAHALAAQQGPRLVNLARHIVEHGLDPTTLTAVIALPGRRRRYKVLEGNRRLLALRALDSPSRVTPALEPREAKAISVLASEFAANPIARIACIRFDTEDEARPWIELRHERGDGGAGLVEWNAEEKRRYEARFGPGSVELQVLDFVKEIGAVDLGDEPSTFITNINRALMSAKLQAMYGLCKDSDGRVASWFPADEIKKPLTKMVDDMRRGEVNSRKLGDATDRENYFKSFKRKELPDPRTRLDAPIALVDLAHGYAPGARGRTAPAKQKRPQPRVRTTLIPKDCSLNPSATRLQHIATELKSLNVNDFPNACSVLLRVFTELAMDDVIGEKDVQGVTEDDKLAKKIKSVADYLRNEDQIAAQLKKAIDSVANSNTHILAAGVFTWHQYVHNRYAYPKPTDLRTTWDELQPFFQALWP